MSETGIETSEVDGLRVLVTGASSGLGAALAEGLAERGAIVGLCARRADRLEEVLARVQVHAPASRAWSVDLADLDGIDRFAAPVVEELGGLDLLINNAGHPQATVGMGAPTRRGGRRAAHQRRSPPSD